MRHQSLDARTRMLLQSDSRANSHSAQSVLTKDRVAWLSRLRACIWSMRSPSRARKSPSPAALKRRPQLSQTKPFGEMTVVGWIVLLIDHVFRSMSRESCRLEGMSRPVGHQGTAYAAAEPAAFCISSERRPCLVKKGRHHTHGVVMKSPIYIT